MAKKKKVEELTIEEKLDNALVQEKDQPYKIPQNWCWVKISSVSSIYTGNSINEKVKAEKYENNPEGLIYIATKDIDFDGYINYETNVKISDYENFKIAPANTSLLCIEGGSAGKKVGFIDQPVCFVNKLCAFSSKEINSKCIFYFLRTNCFINQFNLKKHGLIGGVPLKDLVNLPFPLPPLAEQERIANKLDNYISKLDEAKEKLEKVVELQDYLKEVFLHRAIAGKLTKSWRDRKKISLDNWQKYLLKDILLPMTSKRPSGEYFRYIDIDSIDNKLQEVKEPKNIETSKASSRANRELKTGDVIFSLVRPYLKNIALIDENLSDCIASTGFYICRCGEKIIPEYLYRFLCANNSIHYLDQFMRGFNSPAIRNSDLLNMPINLPPIEEQKEIVKILDSLLSKEKQVKEIAEEQLKVIGDLKKNLLTRAFAGILGTNDPNEEDSIELLKTVL